MAGRKFDQSDYVDVAHRIVEFRTKHPDGSLQPFDPANPYRIEAIGQQTFIVYQAAAYRTPDDPRPGVGTAWEPFPGRTPFTRDSELQNAETSAWGRAIMAAMAADAKKGIASHEEVRNRKADQDFTPTPQNAPTGRQAPANGNSGEGVGNDPCPDWPVPPCPSCGVPARRRPRATGKQPHFVCEGDCSETYEGKPRPFCFWRASEKQWMAVQAQLSEYAEANDCEREDVKRLLTETIGVPDSTKAFAQDHATRVLDWLKSPFNKEGGAPTDSSPVDIDPDDDIPF